MFCIGVSVLDPEINLIGLCLSNMTMDVCMQLFMKPCNFVKLYLLGFCFSLDVPIRDRLSHSEVHVQHPRRACAARVTVVGFFCLSVC